MSALGFGLDSLSSALGVQPDPGLTPLLGQLPWSSQIQSAFSSANANPSAVPTIDAVFFPPIAIRGELWDKLMPYRLLVVDTSTSPPTIIGGPSSSESTQIQVQPLGNGTLSFEPMDTSWEFFFPITPQQLSITDAYSINTSATLRGILEEHSGVRFKNIVIQATFGVWPGRPSIVNPPGTPSALQSVFGGTIAAAQNVATQFQSIINAATTGSLASKPVTIRPGDPGDSEGGLGTGYYQTMVLQQFLEQYAEAKRNPANASWRLVLDLIRQNQSFVVTPVSFTWSENVNRPMEINFNLQLKAWRRIDLDANLVSAPLDVTPLSPGILQQILNTIQAAQNTAAAATSLIGSVRSDVDNILNIIRQTGLFVKQLAGVSVAVNDLPSQLTKDAQSTISTFIANLSTANNLFGQAATDPTTLNAISNIKILSQTNEGLSTTAVANGQLGSSAAVTAFLNPSNAVFQNALQYPLLFSQVPVNSLTLNTAQQNALQTELTNVSNFTVQDLKNMRATILTLTSQLANSFGAGDAYYSTLFNQPQPITTTQPMNLDQFDILQQFYELIQSYDVLTATNQLDNNQILNSEEYVSALAATSDIEFSVPNSKIQVPVPYGLNMEQIAQRYLGDPLRWLEIATLNFLQEPYLDENGFILSLLTNADGRDVFVNSSEDLFIGQTVYLYANNQTPTARTIMNITMISQNNFLITLDGLANLDDFTVEEGAYLKAYLPGTVNSQNVIWIPSSLQTTVDDQINIPASVANTKLVGLSKVDWLLSPYGDIVTDNQGDFQLAAGLPNLVQALAIKFGTQIKTSLLNPDFGLSVRPGSMVSDTSAVDIYNQISNMITSDPRFSGVSGLQVNLQPPGVMINLGVQLAGIQGVFPIGFTLPTSLLQ